eukprot:CAMPEP_0203746920 /NCGR_PEP_ID=MMETSP0098-20131031/2207_1 /ASSEMBLY_ACC=CAM_ASM_000208 /TAXON_ID=96639 /ORGANISM=" , Strain NY0313808BC1" /LENGTH=289 /DNA_ID=CAMNT_0050635173 /DNA_START=2142 /DNA_END=3008 /DNA_ORIENTATION=+
MGEALADVHVDIEQGEKKLVEEPVEGGSASSEDVEDLSIKRRLLFQECVAEFFGTLVIVLFGTGSVAQRLVFGENSLIEVHFCWGFAVMLGVLVAYRVSGAQLNPAVTLGAWSVGGVPTYKVLPYILSQWFGGFIGAALNFLFYFDTFQNSGANGENLGYLGKNLTSAGVFVTSRGSYVSWGGAFADEVIGTAFLLIAIFAITDSKLGPNKAQIWHVATYVGMAVMAIGMAFGVNTGYAINPARDFGPRCFLACAGWGSEVFTAGEHYFLVPLFAPLVGGVIGAQIMRW